MNKPLVSIVIPTYKRKEKLNRLLDSILKSSYPKIEIIVVVDDNDNYDDMIKTYPNINFIFNKNSMFLAESRNIGIKRSNGEYIFLIDDDNVVDKECISTLVDFMEAHRDAGITGPIMYYLKDPKRIWCAGVKINYYTSITTFIKRGINDDLLNEPIQSEGLPNAFMIRKSVIDKVGYFDSKNFTIHYDEGDFGRRVICAGYKIYVIPQAKVWHDIDLPNTDNKADAYHLKNEYRVYYMARNRILFFKKYSTNFQFFIFIAIFNWLITLYYIKVIFMDSKLPFGKRANYILTYLKGVLDGLKLCFSI